MCWMSIQNEDRGFLCWWFDKGNKLRILYFANESLSAFPVPVMSTNVPGGAPSFKSARPLLHLKMTIRCTCNPAALQQYVPFVVTPLSALVRAAPMPLDAYLSCLKHLVWFLHSRDVKFHQRCLCSSHQVGASVLFIPIYLRKGLQSAYWNQWLQQWIVARDDLVILAIIIWRSTSIGLMHRW